MKKIFLILICTFVTFIPTFAQDDKIQDDILNYINVEIPKVAELENVSIDAYASVSGENYTNDKVMYEKINNVVVPKYTEFNKKLKQLKIKTKEVKALHAEYVEAAKDQLRAFKLILVALKKQDASIIEKANKDLNAAVKLIDDWKIDLDALCKKHGVVLN